MNSLPADGTEPDVPVHGTWGDPCYAAGSSHEDELLGEGSASVVSDSPSPHEVARSDVR